MPDSSLADARATSSKATANPAVANRGTAPSSGQTIRIVKVNFLPDALKKKGAGPGARWALVPGQKGFELVGDVNTLQRLAAGQIVFEYDPGSRNVYDPSTPAGQEALQAQLFFEDPQAAFSGLHSAASGGETTLFEDVARTGTQVAAGLNFEDPKGVKGGHRYGSPLGANPDADSNPYLQFASAIVVIAATVLTFADPRTVLSKVALSMERRASLQALRVRLRGARKGITSRFAGAAAKKIAAKALTGAEKDVLREEAKVVWALHHGYEIPIFKTSARAAASQRVAIHHILPLEYAHLFPHKNPNAMGNLVAATPEAHIYIHRFWTQFRKTHPNPTPAQVEKAIADIGAELPSWSIVAKRLK